MRISASLQSIFLEMSSQGFGIPDYVKLLGWDPEEEVKEEFRWFPNQVGYDGTYYYRHRVSYLLTGYWAGTTKVVVSVTWAQERPHDNRHGADPWFVEGVNLDALKDCYRNPRH